MGPGAHCRGGTPWPPLDSLQTSREGTTFVSSWDLVRRGWVPTEWHPYKAAASLDHRLRQGIKFAGADNRSHLLNVSRHRPVGC